MSRRRPLALTLAAVFAALTLFATACSSSDKADDSRKTTTTAEKDSKSSDSSKSSEPTSTLDDGAFSAEVSKAEESLA
ncbi:MAG: hypothetical protein JST64_11350, partial [Actinobacteria bacterium]|nr:hypothetical protein [Actinomycetota bacterium]